VVTTTAYDSAKTFTFHSAPVNDLTDLLTALQVLETDPHAFVIRGKPVTGVVNGSLVRRTLAKNGGFFEEDPLGKRWFMADVDKQAVPDGLSLPGDLDAMRGYIISLLPEELRDASYIYQWSSSTGVHSWKVASLHAFFWLATPLTDSDLEDWAIYHQWLDPAKGKLIDPATLRTVQPNYTARPIFTGMDDPLGERRSGFHQGDRDAVTLNLPPSGFNRQRALAEIRARNQAAQAGVTLQVKALPVGTMTPRQSNYVTPASVSAGSRYLAHLFEIGDDRQGFHEPILRAVASYAMSAERPDPNVIKGAVRKFIKNAKVNEARADVAYYKSDEYLDRIYAEAVSKYSSN
jgi:hypothetical protein